ncbi:MAG TPA: type IV pilus secretin PilQ [Nitrococcus sp.]|nr:type IV pilus secretin PilQ [Nitrococcus sp.]
MNKDQGLGGTMRIMLGGARAAPVARRLLFVMLLLSGGSRSVQAADNVLRHIDYSTLSGNRVEITLTLDKPVAQPQSFKTNNPARIALDFMGTSDALAQRSMDVGIGAVNSVDTAEAGNRTRVVIKLSQMVPYTTQVDGNKFHILLQPPTAMVAAPNTGNMQAGVPATGEHQITKIDFQRGASGAGKVIVDFSDPSTTVDVHQEGSKVIADFMRTQVPAQLQRRLDVTDFATPVQTVATTQRGDSAQITITASGTYDEIAYQADNRLTIEIKPVSKAQKEQDEKKAFQYTGQRLSLNFQNIEVRSVLQLIADFTGINLVVSDSVTGNITLRLQNVPWDQALDIILQTKGLAKRQTGNVMLIAPAAEIAAREKLELQSKQQIQQLAPLQSAFIQVNYAKAQDLAQLILGGGQKGRSLLSDRGTVNVDERTNTLIVRDTESNLDDIRRLVSKLDIPVRQVLIESRVVIANNDFSNELGVRFGYSRNSQNHSTIGGKDTIVGGKLPGDVNYGGTTAFEVPAGSGNEGLLVDLPVTNAAGAVGLAVGKIGSYLLQLELSAMENENRGEIISSPRVITTNQKEAYIKQGVEIPFQQATSSGATSVQFKEAVLGLTVTPQITPDDRILLDLQVTKDSIGQNTAAGPAINTQAVGTQVLVNNGETVVLGGVYERTKTNGVTRVPFFGDLPLLGFLFRNTQQVNNNSELLIFVTPKILKGNMALNQ